MITLVLNSNRLIASDILAKPFLCTDLVHNFDKAASELDFLMLQGFDVILDGVDSFDALVDDMTMQKAMLKKPPVDEIFKYVLNLLAEIHVSECMDDKHQSFTKDDLEHFRSSTCNEVETNFMQIYNECRLDALNLVSNALNKYCPNQFLILD